MAELEELVKNPAVQIKLAEALEKLKNFNFDAPDHKFSDSSDEILIPALLSTKEQLDKVRAAQNVTPQNCTLWTTLLDNLQGNVAEESTVDDQASEKSVSLIEPSQQTHQQITSQFFIQQLKQTHQQIIKESNLHVGLTIRAGMLYAQTLLLIILPLILSLKFLLLSSGVDSDVAQEVHTFFLNLAWGSPALVGMLANRETFNALQKKWLALFLAGFNAISNAGFGAIFFYGWPALNIPSFGTAGIAATFSTTAWLTFLSGNIILWKNPFFKKFDLFSIQGGDFWHQFKQTIQSGLQVFGMALPDYALLTIVMVLVSRYAIKFGVPADVAQGAFALSNLIVYILSLGLADTTVNLASRAVKAVNPQQLMAYVKISMVMQGLIGLTAAGLLWGIPDQLFNVFCLAETCDIKEIEQFRAITSYGTLAIIFDTLIIGIKSCLAGIRDLNPSMFISITSLLVLGMSLQFGVGVPNDMTPAQLNLLRVLAILPSLIAHSIRGFDQIKEADQVLTQAQVSRQKKSPTDTHDPSHSSVVIFYDEDDVQEEPRTCWSRVLNRASSTVRQASGVFSFFGSSFRQRYTATETTAPQETQPAEFTPLSV
ncbi:MAG: hypothetical protein GKR77_05570 [Legionellales bacterium]|nr:hypothetical protein [Legionellales bacterium]